MASIDIITTDRRGRVRPAPPWRRFDASQLRLARLAAALEQEAERYYPGSEINILVTQAAEILRSAASPNPSE